MLLEVCFLTFTSVFILCTKTKQNLCLAGISFCKTPSSFPFWLFRAWNVPANPNCLRWRVLQRLDKGGSFPPRSCEQAPDSKLSSLQSSHLTLLHFWRTQGQTSPSSYSRNRDLLSQTSSVLLKWPPSTRAHLSSLCHVTQAGKSPQILLLYVKTKKLNIWLLRVICLSASRRQLSYQRKSLQGPSGMSTAGLSISSASVSNTDTEKLNCYGIKTLLPPTIIKEVNFLV